jgi:hypothetical protein
MIYEESLFEFVCAKKSADQHFVKDPFKFDSCGHLICKDCLLNPYIEPCQPVICGKCGQVNNRNLRNDKESKISKEMIKKNLSRLYEQVEKLTFLSFSKISSI